MQFIFANPVGPDGLIIVIVVAVVLFGSTQIPKIARSLGSAQKEFKKGLDEGAAEDATPAQVAPPATLPPTIPPVAAPQPQAGSTPDNAS